MLLAFQTKQRSMAGSFSAADDLRSTPRSRAKNEQVRVRVAWAACSLFLVACSLLPYTARVAYYLYLPARMLALPVTCRARGREVCSRLSSGFAWLAPGAHVTGLHLT